MLLRARALSGETEIASAFNEARDRDYKAISDSCDDAAGTIGAMIANGDLRDGQLSDGDAALERLDRHYRAVARLDLLGAAEGAAALAALQRYRSLLDQYARRLDATDNLP